MSEVEKEGYQKKEKERSAEIEFREYQVQIAKKCTLRNSLVVLPTGLGKTVIAVLVAANILNTVPEGSKIVIIAPTRPLINQHYESFIQKLPIPEEKFAILTGKIPPQKREEIFRDRQVLFYTPQTLRNDLVNGKYTLKKACLLVIDEAHHASGDYPYALITDKFVDQNSDGIILALTASPGATKEKISTLCEALHVPVENIHIRSRKDLDVKEYVKPMDIFKIGVGKTSLMEECLAVIELILEERLQFLSQRGFLEGSSRPLKETIMRKDLIKLNSELVEIIKGKGDKTGAYGSVSINAQALILHHMIDLVEQQGLDILLEYLEKLHIDARKKNSSKALKNLAMNQQLRSIHIELRKNQDFTPEKLIHPKYQVLERYLEQELASVPDSKILVFVKLRNSVANITNKLNKHPTIKAVKFVGQATKSKNDIGISQKMQIKILDEFKRGIYNVLVATNVAEEGLDIAECDLVIFFDVVASETRLIQRKGRTARHRKGKVIILYCKNTRDEIYLNIAMKRLKKMNYNLTNRNLLQKDIIDQNISEKKEIQFPNSDSTSTKSLSTSKKHDNSLKNQPEKKRNGKRITQFSLEDFTKKSNSRESSKPKIHYHIGRNIPMRIGLRKKLTELNLPFSFVDSQEHVVIGKKIAIQIYANENIDLSIITKNDNAFKNKYKLVVHVCDFSEFIESFDGQKRLEKRKLREFAGKYDLRLICIDNHEELYFLLRNIQYQEKRIEV
ncbi:MAG: helicase-related protein [Promethearchaeota archaeon]